MFFFNDTAPTGIYTLSLHDALPITETIPAFATWAERIHRFVADRDDAELRRLRVRIEDKGPIMAFHWRGAPDEGIARDRKSTRLNSSHANISYAVFCLKKIPT